MKMHLAIAAVAVGSLAVVACAASRPPIVLYEGPDRPGGLKIEGPPPPGDYKFGPTEQHTQRLTDTNDDQRPDRVEFLDVGGEVTWTAEDTNFDGKIDVYKKISHGVVVEEVRDRNFDGILDQRGRDTDGDGKLDLLEPLTP